MPVWNALINYLILVKSLFFLFLVFSSYADCRVLTAKLFLTTFENSSACNTFALRPETSTPSNQNTRTFPSGSSPFCFQAHLFSLLPPQFSATFKIIHGVVSGLGGPEKVWAGRQSGVHFWAFWLITKPREIRLDDLKMFQKYLVGWNFFPGTKSERKDWFL